jgi:hypothetical protein
MNGIGEIEIQTLRLADERSSADCELHQSLLGNLPHRLIDLSDTLGDALDALHASIVRDDLIFDF